MRTQHIVWILLLFTGYLYAQDQEGTQVIVPSAQGLHPSTLPTSDGLPTYLQQVTEMGARQNRLQGPVPFSIQQVLKEIKKYTADTVVKEVVARGVDFDMTPSLEQKLRKAEATEDEVEAVRQSGPKVRARMAKLVSGTGLAGIQNVPREQARELSTIMAELDPDRTIALVDSFVKKYPASPVLSHVYYFGANAYQQKAEFDKAVEYCAESLKAKPDNVLSLLLSLSLLPHPQYLNSHAADREKILEEAESEATRTLAALPHLPKRATETDADYEKRQTELASEVHGALGMIHFDRANQALLGVDKAELARAEEEFKTAVATSSHPEAGDCYYMGAAYGLDGKWDDAIRAFSKAGELGHGTVIETYAAEQVAEMKKRKAERPAKTKS
jgi:tetratricopeptide (TPR) repeat protein